MQLLLQPHTGAVAVAAHAQLLPLQVSLPAVDAVSAVLSALSTESGDDQQPEQRRQQQQRAAGPRQPPPSAAAVAAAATFIIEDASATLDHYQQQQAAAADAGAGTGAAPSGNEQQPHTDDLSAALFTFVHSSGENSSRPEPLQVQTFSSSGGGSGRQAMGGSPGTAAGLGARLWGAASGRQEQQAAARQGIRWCYPQQREVALLAVEVSCVSCASSPAHSTAPQEWLLLRLLSRWDSPSSSLPACNH
jgi:hypothetical protein